MADIRAFRGIRYDLGRAGPLSDLVAPPYDVIDPDLQQALYQRSPYNAIRLELPLDQADDTPSRNRYTRAAQALHTWLHDHILVQDSLRSLYVVEQEFSLEGQTYCRRGFIARVRLEPFGSGRIFPHEETMSGPKEDRFRLMKACAMNLSPIFGLYPDPSNEVFARLEGRLRNVLPVEARDHLGVVSRLWPVTDEHTIGAVISAMADRPIFLADGHHRYETSLRYLEDARAAGLVPNDEAAPHFTMMMLVSMADPGLIILPTHRLIRGFPGLDAGSLRSALEPHFECVPAPSLSEAWETITIEGTQDILGMYTAADGQWQLVRLRDADLMPRLAPDHSNAWRDLAVSILHVAILDDRLAARAEATPLCRYVHRLSEVAEAIEGRSCDLAALVPPVRMHHVERIAGRLEKMPAKSTYFYPKLLTGLVFHSLKGH